MTRGDLKFSDVAFPQVTALSFDENFALCFSRVPLHQPCRFALYISHRHTNASIVHSCFRWVYLTCTTNVPLALTSLRLPRISNGCQRPATVPGSRGPAITDMAESLDSSSLGNFRALAAHYNLDQKRPSKRSDRGSGGVPRSRTDRQCFRLAASFHGTWNEYNDSKRHRSLGIRSGYHVFSLSLFGLIIVEPR